MDVSMDLETARKVLTAVEDRARELELGVCAAVLDAGANPVATVRMDGAQLGAYPLAIDKAWTAVAFQAPTDQWAGATEPGAPAWGFSTALAGRVIVFAGGIPLFAGGRVAGAVGVSGSSGLNDTACATAGAETWAEIIKER
jgi:glc operon protein GlcG